ncbi:MAG: c-type cytochrome [Bacteroidia bacterium]|nr:c-type cytochrome [Bacteroidia bacterium]
MATRAIVIRFLALLQGMFFIPVLSGAQVAQQPAATTTTFPAFLIDPITYLWLLVFVVLLAVIFAMSRAIRILGEVINGKKVAELQSESFAKVKVEDSAWTKLMKLMTRSVPIEQEADVMLDHDYDGIRELDNKLPPWWVWGFYITIIFAFVYIIHYHITGSGELQLEEYQSEIQMAALDKEKRIAADANYVTEANVVQLMEPNALGEGKNIYVKNCVACHGNEGQGGVGPNMTDEYWINGGGMKNVFRVITEGVPAKGMISWKTQLSPKQIQYVSSYILAFQGTNPASPKAPQGEKWVEIVADSSNTKMTADSTQSAKLK